MDIEDLKKTLVSAKNFIIQAAKSQEQIEYSIDIRRGLDTVAKCLDEYIEPWICPDCGHCRKIPVSFAEPGRCPVCASNNMLPYSYKEQARMSAQLRHLLQCAQYYSKQKNGGVASVCLQNLAKLDIQQPAK